MRPVDTACRVAVVIGTRPEAIKLAPVVAALRNQGTATTVIATSQHRELLHQALAPFALVPDVDLDIMKAGQTPAEVLAAVASAMPPVLERVTPNWVVVQGDTTSALAAALTAFYARIPVAHVEAGLRSGNLAAPFPEELNRRAISTLATLHFAPTRHAAANLQREGVPDRRVLVVGNTVVDAVRMVLPDPPPRAVGETPLALVTLHRRESFGAPLARMLDAVAALARERAGRLRVVYPVHPNPAVDGPARARLSGLPGVDLVAPLPYPEFLALLARARLVLTDSGGVQEEAPSLGVPVVVLRDETERPELLESGWGVLAGTDPEAILAHARSFLDDEVRRERLRATPNPFGDGHSAPRIIAAITRPGLC